MPSRVWINGSTGFPGAAIDVDRETNPDGDDVYYQATSGDAILPVMLSNPYTETVDVHIRVESPGNTITETIPFSAGIQVRFLNIINPMPNPNMAISLTVSVTGAGVPPIPADVTDRLIMEFVEGDPWAGQCVLCYADWLLKFVGFEPDFWTLHHMNLPDQEASPQWEYYEFLFSIYSPEMTSILATNPSVLWTALPTLEDWSPAVKSLELGTGDTFTVTTEMANNAESLVNGFKSNASPSLQVALQQEQDALNLPSFAGLTMDEAWLEFQIRRPVSVSELYVTIVLKNASN